MRGDSDTYLVRFAEQSANNANETCEYPPSLADGTFQRPKAQWQAISNIMMINRQLFVGNPTAFAS